MFPRTALLAAATLLAACGGGAKDDQPGPSGPVGYFLVITGNGAGATFSPLSAPSGATVTIANTDTVAHRLVSEAAPNDFTPGTTPADPSPFDTGPFTGNKTVTLASGLPDGTLIRYYCEIHKGAEATPNGTITIVAAQPPAPPGGGGY